MLALAYFRDLKQAITGFIMTIMATGWRSRPAVTTSMSWTICHGGCVRGCSPRKGADTRLGEILNCVQCDEAGSDEPDHEPAFGPPD